MRNLPLDIIDEMKLRFESDYPKAQQLLSSYLNTYDYLDSDRVIRCVIFLSKNSIERFTKYLEAAKVDPRDVMWWAEYKPESAMANNTRIYDFSNRFNESEI